MYRTGHGSLFDRLEAPAPSARARTGTRRAVAAVTAVKRHIEVLLNARTGGAQSCPSMGLPDFNDAVMGSADLLVKAAAGIRGAIEDNEPRVRVGRVRWMPSVQHSTHLCFRVDCDLILDHVQAAFEMDLVLNGHTRSYSAI